MREDAGQFTHLQAADEPLRHGDGGAIAGADGERVQGRAGNDVEGGSLRRPARTRQLVQDDQEGAAMHRRDSISPP